MVKKLKAGVTIFELLIVVSIIVILASIALMVFRGQQFKGNDARRKGDMHNIKVAVEEYEKDHDCYPLSIACNPGLGLKPYLSKIPCDPVNNASYFYDHADSSCPSWYRIYTKLQNSNDLDISKVGCKYGCGPGNSFNYVDSSPNAPLTTGQAVTPNPQGSSEIPPVSGFYACRGGVCVPIDWDPSRPGPECDPNFQNSDCYGSCVKYPNCTDWKQD